MNINFSNFNQNNNLDAAGQSPHSKQGDGDNDLTRESMPQLVAYNSIIDIQKKIRTDKTPNVSRDIAKRSQINIEEFDTEKLVKSIDQKQRAPVLSQVASPKGKIMI